MRPRWPLDNAAVGGAVIAGLLLAVGVMPVGAQPPPQPSPQAPAPAPPSGEDEGGVYWGPTVEQTERERPPVVELPEERPAPRRPARRPRRPSPGPRDPAPERDAPNREAAPECSQELRADVVPLDDPPRERALPKRAACEPPPEGRPRRDPALRRADGSPAPSNPGFMDALPGPSFATGVPNFVIRKFRVPIFLLPIYQAAGIEYGVRWEILAAINEIETDYGRNLNVSSAGALGWMQFIPSSWRAYGVDANKDGKKDPYNPVDAIFAAARYLKAADYENDVRGAVFAYNHADWYVDSVMLRARLISGVPADLVGSLTGLTEGRFPVAARARYADDLAERSRKPGGSRTIEIYARRHAPVVATTDGVVERVGSNRKLGRYIKLTDVYGNRFTYSGLGSTARLYPAPREDSLSPAVVASALTANPPAPVKPASAGRQPERARPRESRSRRRPSAVKQRLFAHPEMPRASAAGGLEQLYDAAALRGEGGYATHFARPLRLDPARLRLKRLRAGSRVIGGTVLGRVGRPDRGKAAHVEFGIRPAGKGAPDIDPKPILDGWKLLEATAVYRASGRNVLYGADGDGFSIGQILLLPKPLLERRVLSDERIEIYDCGRDDIRSGQIDRRVLATMAYLAESGLRPTITSLKCGHGFFTSSGNVSHHSSGNAMDVAQVNGVPILGHQEPGGITEQAVRRLMALQGTVAPDQIISLLEMGGSTFAMGDHDDHIHVGFAPMFGENGKLGMTSKGGTAPLRNPPGLKPGQWSDLIAQLRKIDNPVVPTSPSKYSLRTRPAD